MVRVTTAADASVSILFFIANPTQITAGQSATLAWSTQDATTVSISGIGNVPLSGIHFVSPTVTTHLHFDGHQRNQQPNVDGDGDRGRIQRADQFLLRNAGHDCCR